MGETKKIEKCQHCGKEITGEVVAWRGGLYCKQLCVIQKCRKEKIDEQIFIDTLAAEIEEINLENL